MNRFPVSCRTIAAHESSKSMQKEEPLKYKSIEINGGGLNGTCAMLFIHLKQSSR
jgi:hypothetical protein